MSHKNRKHSFFFYLADRMAGPLMAATLVGCLLAGRMETLHLVFFSIGFGLFLVSYLHNIISH